MSAQAIILEKVKLASQVEKSAAKLDAVRFLFDRAFEEAAKFGFSVLMSRNGSTLHYSVVSRQGIKLQKADVGAA